MIEHGYNFAETSYRAAAAAQRRRAGPAVRLEVASEYRLRGRAQRLNSLTAFLSPAEARALAARLVQEAAGAEAL